MLVGYSKEIKGYYFYLTEDQTVIVGNRIVFLEKEFLREGTNVCKIELDEVQEVEGPTHRELNLIGESNSKPVEAPLRRFSREPC